MSHRHVAAAIATLALVSSSVHAQGSLTPSSPRRVDVEVPPPLLIGKWPQVWVPRGNPMTPDKVQLGKALFFEEQMSSDDTMACATCHLPEAGGGDTRASALAKAPGVDGVMNTVDDEFGSFGVVAHDQSGDFVDDPVFGVRRQVTGRGAPSVIGAAFFNTQFWNSRAKPVFEDLDGNVVLSEYASLESQAVEPPLSSVEMSHRGRTWADITAKLARVRPLALASNLPPALDQFIGNSQTYGPLFAKVWGDDTITRERVAMSIATYERTLIPDQTPFDLGTMTATQQAGLAAFNRANCQKCHLVTNGLFTDGMLQTIDLPNHRRDVKTPGLRNAGLKKRFMSGGTITSMSLVLQHYQQIGLFDPVPGEVGALRDFLENALTDPRVPARLPPFDRPTLHSESVLPGANLFGTATRGTSQITPVILADTPPFLGNPAFKIGLGSSVGQTMAVLVLSPRKAAPGATYYGVPLAVDLPFSQYKLCAVGSAPPGHGVATYRVKLPTSPGLIGHKFYAQWFVKDPGAVSGVSATRAAEFEVFTRP